MGHSAEKDALMDARATAIACADHLAEKRTAGASAVVGALRDLVKRIDAACPIPPADERDPRPCPKCGEVCKYDGWGHVHANGIGIGSCHIPPGSTNEGATE